VPATKALDCPLERSATPLAIDEPNEKVGDYLETMLDHPLILSHLRPPRDHHILNHMVQYNQRLDATFAAVADPVRRGILGRLGKRDASISELAEAFDMTLTGMKKHVAVLEDAGLLLSEKVGRVRTCRLAPRNLDLETEWLRRHQAMVEERLDALGQFLERTKGDQR
jgi:DNA-binding transcriptional ArsR family regulator